MSMDKPNVEHISEAPRSIRVVSYNCFGLKYIAKHRRERLKEIGVQLAKVRPSPEIVGLQECWTQEDYHAIRERTKHILPYGKNYFSGIFGSGLAILSKWPIIESSMYRYPLNGRPAAFYRGDWYVGKGVACASIRIGPTADDIVEVFCTHLHAPYEREPNDSYVCHRTAQAWEIARLMRNAAERGRIVLGLGDFNMTPSSLAHRLISSHAPVSDVWLALHPDSAVASAESIVERARGASVPSSDESLSKHGTTCDHRYNTWRWDKKRAKMLDNGQDSVIDGSEPDLKAQRLDYIFVGGSRPHRPWSVQAANVGMLERHPTLKYSLSDHFSVEATLVCGSLDGSTSHGQPSTVKVQDTGRQTSSPHDMIATYDEILGMIRKYEARERKQRRLRLGHFVLEVVLAVGCLVAVWWSPHNYVSFILMFISTFGLSAGVIDGLMGGLFVGSELRALHEFEWDISNARAFAVEKCSASV